MNNFGQQAGLCERSVERQFGDRAQCGLLDDRVARFADAGNATLPEGSSAPWLTDSFDERLLSQFIMEPLPRSLRYRFVGQVRRVAMRCFPPIGRFVRVKRAVHKSLAILANEGAVRLGARFALKLTRLVQERLEFGPEARQAKATRERLKLIRVIGSMAAARRRVGGAGRSRAEVEHLLEHRCQACRYFSGSACSQMKKHFWRTSRKVFVKAIADASGLCPKGSWPDPASPPVTRLNLVYFICPIRHPNRVWQWNVAELLRRIHVFNGRRIVTVATEGDPALGRGMPFDPPEAVVAAFAGHDVEFRFVANDPQRGESPHFLSAMREVASTNPTEAIFYAHAKGVSRLERADAVRAWAAAMYHHNLDRIDEVSDLLQRWPCVGMAKSYGFPAPFLAGKARKTIAEAGRPWHGWHYSGSFWWVRSSALFSRPDWDDIEIYNYATEKYLASFFTAEEAFCLAYDNFRCETPYDMQTWAPEASRLASAAIVEQGRELKAA